MARYETNVFAIRNLEKLSNRYRKYLIRGISPEQDEYFQNQSAVARRMSYELQTPATVVEEGGQPMLIVRNDAPRPPALLQVVRAQVMFEPIGTEFNLDYTDASPVNQRLRENFLRFALQRPLHHRNDLWQPTSGGGYFEKQGQNFGEAVHFPGFRVRVVQTQGGELGLCVDYTSKFLRATPLSVGLDRNSFADLKGRRGVYRFGNDWFEIRPDALLDFDVTEYQFLYDGRAISLYDFLMQTLPKPFPEEIRDLPEDAKVVAYRNNRGESRAAPAPLVYPVLGSNHREVARRLDLSRPEPSERRWKIRQYVDRYLRSLKLDGVPLEISKYPVEAKPRMFQVPDLMFGSRTVLSVRGTVGAVLTSLERLGQERLNLLRDSKVGFHEVRPLYRQYLILPQSVADSYGPRFKQDLIAAVLELYPGGHYDPIVVVYPDRGPKTLGHQGRAILRAFEGQVSEPGYCVAMIHEVADRKLREEDALAAMLTHTLRNKDFPTAVIHVPSSSSLYRSTHAHGGSLRYDPDPTQRGRLNGYLRNVALNKVLLTNGLSPFVLATPLHADLTIGLDVKNNTAGLVAVSRRGERVHSLVKTSNQKERLLAEQAYTYLLEVVQREAQEASLPPKTIVIHRDGRVYESELKGFHRAMDWLRGQGTIDPNATLSVVEISKSAPAPFRLFDTALQEGQRPKVQNPTLGLTYVVDACTGYVCTTGAPLQLARSGTVKPLHIHRVTGPLSMAQILEDIFYLSNLAWSRPEGCTRYPITVKLNDRLLRDVAGEFDDDELNYEGLFEEELS